ncbi:hypothetical protein DesfrDRAFT_4005 [Solidesulfovibrio fructosivorans JJ]]|uniref:Lipoprotein n=1 Tax=Solidesulfovibrio fructosivorans JJ] TaxID=596151 RepID=E1K2A5_SOLFR|nr:hypothetical protein [Solidesulfovibrio fructosivorans]EFL49260.1 hypothetical protein DesfrDRAFT_4005 [Solidesulfovibrio fructosivorans JJ]]
MVACRFNPHRLTNHAFLIAFGLLLFLLGGCASKASLTQLSSFSTNTDRLSDDTMKFYGYMFDLHENFQKDQYLASIDKNISILHYQLSYLPSQELTFRKLLFTTLKKYAQNLKYIMSDDINSSFETNITDLAGVLQSFKDKILPNVTLPETITKDTVATAANKIADWFLEKKKQKIARESLANVTPYIVTFVEVLKDELGTCGDTTDSSQYCASVPDQKKPVAVVVSQQICDNLQQYMDAADRAAMLATKPADILANRKTAYSYRYKRDRACESLAALRQALDAYETAVTSLPVAITDKKTETLARALGIVAAQLEQFETVFAKASL